MEEFNSFYRTGVIQFDNGMIKCFKREIRDEILEFILERLKDENLLRSGERNSDRTLVKSVRKDDS